MLEVSYMASCPNCRDVRFQQAYTGRSLVRLLIGGHPIEAHCVVCDDTWEISAGERAEIARRLLSLLGNVPAKPTPSTRMSVLPHVGSTYGLRLLRR